MLPQFMNPFKGEEALEEQQKQLKKKKLINQKRKSSACDDDDDGGGRRSQTTMELIGLKLVTKITNSQTKSNNVVVKSALRKVNRSNSTATSSSTPLEYSCFLKTCSLCNKKLSHDKDIYMYRGDQGFCSIECRDRQIIMDEMREVESSTKQRASSSYRNCWNDARRETHLILEDLRLQRLQSKPISYAHHQNHWAIVS